MQNPHIRVFGEQWVISKLSANYHLLQVGHTFVFSDGISASPVQGNVDANYSSDQLD